ncbi:MAG TPA: Tol-Pal system beta propeller repeat protein TolB [Terracidiphilus sp.]|nr:Tol-Pal system beta propeller repeat protein TolB [Terracidiphilus sp.]
MKFRFSLISSALFFLALCASLSVKAQDWVRTGSNLGSQPIRLAAADFKPVGSDPQTPTLKAAFDSTLYNDLNNAGIFEMVSKSFLPSGTPGSPQEINVAQYANDPVNASMVAFGALSATNGRLVVYGWLFDTHNTANPQVLGKQYNEAASVDMARTVAHRFADEIIARLGGGINGIAETKIYFISSRSGSKEVWVMDYDGENQHQVTHLGSVALSPHVSPDNSRVAFESLGQHGWQIRMYSLDLNRMVSFPAGAAGSLNQSPAWSSDGTKLSFSSSRSGDSEIWVGDANGSNLHRLTYFKGPDVSPTWNPKTNAQIAWASGRTGLPQIYIMDQDGSNVHRLTDQGYAVSPSWSPNGQFLTFSWNRKYGPGAPGGQDIYVMDIASLRFIQLTHDSGTNDFPSWAPDGRHIVFERMVGGRTQIWSMLADGTQQHQLTKTGNNFMPDWSWK